MGERKKITGVVFSDLGQASSFMGLDWVQEGLKKSLGFAPFPATLNVRPKAQQDTRTWEAVQREIAGVPLAPADGGFCSARLFLVEVHGQVKGRNKQSRGAILLPEVSNYPKDKIEIVAPVRLKDEFGVQDGDQLTLEFVN